MSFHEEQDYFAPFKKYEYILNNKNETFENKIASLIDVWKSIAELDLPEFDIRHVIQIMDWAKLHALNIVLTAEWNKFKDKYQDKLLGEIEKAQNELLKLNSVFATPCKKLADVVRNPWEDTTLMKLMKQKDAEIGSEEIEFFCVETAYLVSVRLKKLCESQCEDLALNLVTAFMNCDKLSKSQNFNMNATETQMWFIFDIYIALLYKFQEKQKMVALLKELSFDEGLQLVKRFAKKRVKISKIWKNCQRIAIFATQMYISQAVLKYSSELQMTLEQYIELYISLCNADNLQDFSNSIRRISNLADAAGLYVFCDVIQRKAGQKLKPFTIEMYIRALTTDMNELERQKDAKDTEKVEIITQRLANAFVSLADFLDEHVNVARECVLTAFSLAPTTDKLKRIEELAKRSGLQVASSELEWKCRLHPPALPSDEITWICPECGDWMCKPSLDLPKINMALHEALQNSVLGISEALCDDLVVCLSNPRYQILSWFLPWNDLHRLCRMYLQDPQNTKNFVTELKFVDIDYSIFKDIKREPLDELAGIERGYEQYLDQNFVSDEESGSNSEDSMSQDSRPYSLGSDGAGDSLFLPLLPTASQKSDPNTLKSLRMFRPTLKRLKDKDHPGESTPEKVFKPSTIVSESQASTSDQNLSSGSSEGLPITNSTKTASTDDSKNVKTATLPQLGGQVARTEIKATQVCQEITLKHILLSSSVNLVHRGSQNLSKEISFTESATQILNQKIQNKPLLIGSNENTKQNPNKEVKMIVKIPKKKSKRCQQISQQGDHPLRSVLLSSTVGTSIQSLEQKSNVDNRYIPQLVFKTPLLSNPSHPSNRTTVLPMQDKLRATTPCISSNIQQTQAIEKPLLKISAPLSTQQEINSRLSATQSTISLQQKSQLGSQAETPPHIQTSSEQTSRCQTDASSKNSASLLENQLKALVSANSQKETNICLRQSVLQESQPDSSEMSHSPLIPLHHQSLPIQDETFQIVSYPQKTVKPKETTHSSQETSQVESKGTVRPAKIQINRLQPELALVLNSHPQIVVGQKSQLESQSHPSPTSPQKVKCPQTGPNSSEQQTLLSDNAVGSVTCPQPTLQKKSQLSTLPKNQQEVLSASHTQTAATVVSLPQLTLQETPQRDNYPQSTSPKAQKTNLLQTKTANIRSMPHLEAKTELVSQSPTALLEERLMFSLQRLAALEAQKAKLAALMASQLQMDEQAKSLQSTSQRECQQDSRTEANPTPQQKSPLDSPRIPTEEISPLTSPESQETNLSPTKMNVTSPRYIQTTFNTVIPSPEARTSQTEMNPTPQRNFPLDNQRQVTTEVVSPSPPTVQEKCQMDSQHRSTSLTSQDANHLQPELRVTCLRERQTIVEVTSLSQLTVEEKCQRDNQHLTTVHRSQRTSPLQVVDPPPQQASRLDSHPQTSVEIVSQAQPTSQEYQLEHQSAALISQATNLSQLEEMPTSQQVSPSEHHSQTTVVVDRPSPSTSEAECHPENQCQSPALAYQKTSPLQIGMKPTLQQTPLLDSHLQPVVKLTLLTLPEHCQSTALIAQETNQPGITPTCQQEPFLDSHLTKIPKAVSSSQPAYQGKPQPNSHCQQTPAKILEMEYSPAKVYPSHQLDLPLDSHPQTTEISCLQPNLQETCLLDSLSQQAPLTPQETHQFHQETQLDSQPQTTAEVDCSQSTLQRDSQLNIQSPLTQEPSLLQLEMKPKEHHWLPQLRVVLRRQCHLSTVTESQNQISTPLAQDPSPLQTGMKPKEHHWLRQLRVVISPTSQIRHSQHPPKRQCRLKTITKPQKYQIVKKKTKRLGQKNAHSIRPKKPSSGPSKKNLPDTPRRSPPSILQTTNLPSTSSMDYSPQPENTYRVILMMHETPAHEKPLVVPKVEPRTSPLKSQPKSAANPSTSQVSCMTTVSPTRVKSSLSLIASIRKAEWPVTPSRSCSDNSSEEETDHYQVQKGKFKRRRRRPNMFDASQILQDFFSQKRTPSLEARSIHTHSTRCQSSVMRIQQKKDLPYLTEEDEDLSCLTDPTQEHPTIAILSGQICLFHHQRLRVGKGMPSVMYQKTVEEKKKLLEMWSTDCSEGEESEMELDMEDAYRPRSAFLVVEDHPETWAMLLNRRLPRRQEPRPPSPLRKSKQKKSSTKEKKQAPKCSHKAKPSSSYTRRTETTSCIKTSTDPWNYRPGSNMRAKGRNARVYDEPRCYVDLTQDSDSDGERRERRRMRKARRIIRREKAEQAIIDEMKRMSDLAFKRIMFGKPDDPLPEVVDLDLFIEFLKNRGRTPLTYKRISGLGQPIKPFPKKPKESCSSAITKELTVNLCRLSLKELRELGSGTNSPRSPRKCDKTTDRADINVTMKQKDIARRRQSLSHLKNLNRSSDINHNKVTMKGEDEMQFSKDKRDYDSDLENSNLQNTDHESKQKACYDGNLPDRRVPRVLLENICAAKSLLANVPGLNDFHLMQPQNVEHIINVVQVPGVKTQMQTSSQTSTPVTAHIQRVGQPRPSEQKPENSTNVATSSPVSTNISNIMTSSSTGSTTTKSQPSTLINILSQQVIRPANIVPSSSTITGNSNGHTSSRNTSSNGNNSNSTSSSGNSSSTTTPTRRPPFINILSQQIIRPTQATKGAPNNGAYTVTETILPKPSITEPVSSTVNHLTRPTITTTTVIPKTTSVVTTAQGIASSGNISSTIPDTASNSPGTTVGNTQGSTIVQFICKSALPKFQQAFGKTVYQCTAETTEPSTVSESSNTPAATICTIPASTVTPSTEIKKNVTNVAKAVPVNVQSIQGNVIYSRQVPVGQTINLVPPTGATRQVFRIAASNPEQLNLVKDSVIHSKMSALLAAALQSRPKNTETEIQVQDDGTKITLTRPALVQNARIVKPVQLHLPTNVVRAPQPNLSSTTLEQLREFDMVYKQIKERSSNTTPTEITTGEQTQEVATPQRISVTYVNQLPKYTQLSPVVVVSSYSHLQQAATSPALSVTSQSSLSPCTTPTSTPSSAPKITTKTTKGKTFKNHTNNSTTKTSPISKPQQKPQEDEHTTQRIFDILAEYAEQLRNSPDLNNKPAPRRRSNPPTNPSQNSKRKKSSSSTKKTALSNSNVDIDTDDITVGSEDSSGGGMVQLSATDDEQSQSQAATTSTVESSEATTPTCPRQVILTDNPSVGSQPRNVIIADSSVGEALKMSNTAVIVPGSYIMPVSMVKGGQQIAVMSGGSKILATVPARSGQNMLLFQSFTNQNRKGAISAVKYSSLQSVAGISSQSIAGVSAQPPVILPSNSVATAVAIGQQLALKKIGEERDRGEVLLAISQKEDTQPDSVTSVSSDSEDVKIPDQSNLKVDHPSEKIIHTYQKPISSNKSATTVIATSISAQKVHQESCSQPTVISTAKVSTTLNGPMLSHTTTHRFRKATDSERTINRGSEAKEESHNGAKVTNTEPKTYRSSTIYYTNKAKKVTIDSQKPESDAQKQAMLERELRLQKSLSEECEDLGVDEPSTSDLFPEADLLFDSNHSPSFDQNSQEGVKKGSQGTDKEEGTKSSINLFSDDDNSSSLKSDLFEYVEYHTVESALDHQAKQLMNGNNPETESSSCEDNTLLPKCTNISEVTLNSPISPEVYAESSVNKYKFKYTNRKKSDKIKQSDSGGETITNSEDAVSSADSCKLSSEEENYKVVHVAITKSDIVKEENRCELHVCDEFVDSPSGRGARRSVRKLCSCCNGTQDGHHAARKRPNPSRPQTPATPHKKPFFKKR